MKQQDYAYIQQSRRILLDQCATLSEKELMHAHGFSINTIKETLIHMTKAYRNWVGSFLLGNEFVTDFPKEHVAAMTFADVEALFALVDEYVLTAMARFDGQMDTLVSSASSFKAGEEQRTPHHILLHVFTHEFHHKGQVTSMLHLLGHKPHNTNMIIFHS